MPASPNALVWQGQPGHYEVYYLTLTDPDTGVGLWIRYTMLAPVDPTRSPTAALWFLAMDPRPGRANTFARKQTFAIEELQASADPFELSLAGAVLGEDRMAGQIEDARWELRFAPSDLSLQHVHPALVRARAAQTILTLPQADLQIEGTVEFGRERLELQGARGGQAHLWGTKHARNWAWVHCNDLVRADGSPAEGDLVDAVSVVVNRFGRDVGPSTPVVGRIGGSSFASRSPLRVLTNASTYALTGWRFEAIDGSRKLVGEVDGARELMAGVTYEDPDGEPAYCYNSEVASIRIQVWHRARQVGGWRLHETLHSSGRAHFEYGQREPVPGLELLTR